MRKGLSVRDPLLAVAAALVCRLLLAVPPMPSRRPIRSRLSPGRLDPSGRLRRARTWRGVAPASPQARPRNPRLGRIPCEVHGVSPVPRRPGVGRSLPASAHVALRLQRSPRGAQRLPGCTRVGGTRRRAHHHGIANRPPGTAHAWPGRCGLAADSRRSPVRRKGDGLEDQRGSLKPIRLRHRSGDTQLPGLARRARPLTGGDQ